MKPEARTVGADVRRRGLVTSSPASAFTLVELLTVIAILGLIAGLTVPVLKNFAKSDASVGASRQLLDAVARARQLAISQRTTVYLVFVPPNFWNPVWMDANGHATTAWNNLTPAQQIAATNLCDKQLAGYNFLAYGAMGDQPGNHQWHYFDKWQALPDGTFIALAKFNNPSPTPLNPNFDPVNSATATMSTNPASGFNGFNYTNFFPFPVETNPPPNTVPWPALPYIAFNYLGQMTFDGQNIAFCDEYIPLARGSIADAQDPVTRAFQFNPPDVLEVPPGNSVNAYNIVHVDRLTGRAVLEFRKVQ
jgi:prepilin-type N-terminal cleavage/methylation domain-containing protein